MRASFVVVIGFALASCAAATQASFSISAAQCGSDPSACLERCKAEHDPTFCDVGNVQMAEGLAKPGHDRDVASMRDIQAAIERLAAPCRNGVTRACQAADALKPVLDEKRATAEDRAKLVARVRVALQTLENVRVYSADAEALLLTAKNDAASAADLASQKAPLDQLAPAVVNVEKEAQALSDASNQMAAQQRAEREQTAAMTEANERNKRDEEAHKRAIDAARQACGSTGDGPLTPTCFDECKADKASAYCVVLAVHYKNGVKVSEDRAKANDLMKTACDTGNSIACDMLQAWTRKAEAEKTAKADRAKAETSLPGLFAKCEAQRSIVVGLKAQVQAAARTQNQARLEALGDPLNDAGQKLKAIGEELEGAIDTVTGGTCAPGEDQIQCTLNAPDRVQLARHDQLIQRARRSCLLP